MTPERVFIYVLILTVAAWATGRGLDFARDAIAVRRRRASGIPTVGDIWQRTDEWQEAVVVVGVDIPPAPGCPSPTLPTRWRVQTMRYVSTRGGWAIESGTRRVNLLNGYWCLLARDGKTTRYGRARLVPDGRVTLQSG